MKLRKRSEATPIAPESEKRIAEISGQLRDEIRKEVEKPPGGYRYPTVNRVSPKDEITAKDLRPDMRQIVETHWVEDMTAAWEKVRGMLKVGEKRSQHGHLNRALDDGRELSSVAHGLSVTAKLEARRWESANAVTFGAMWAEATRALEHERETKIRSKTITDTDVRMKIASLFPDEYAAQEYDREKVKLTVERFEKLARDASDKVEDIRAMLSKLRG